MLALYIALRWASRAFQATLAAAGAVVTLTLWGAGWLTVIIALMLAFVVAWDSERASDRAYGWVMARRAGRAMRRTVRRLSIG